MLRASTPTCTDMFQFLIIVGDVKQRGSRISTFLHMREAVNTLGVVYSEVSSEQLPKLSEVVETSARLCESLAVLAYESSALRTH